MTSRRLAAASAPLLASGILLLVLPACGMSEPDPAPRVLSVAPEGDGIVPDAPGIAVRFSEPVEGAGVEDGRFLAVAAEADAKSVATTVATATGLLPGGASVPARIRLVDGGTAAEVTPDSPLQPLAAYAVVVGTGIRSVGGRAVLDPTGRKRAFVGTFHTGPMPDRLPPVARWITPPHGPVARNLKELRIGFSEPVSGSLFVNGVAGTPVAAAPDVLVLSLGGPLPAGSVTPVLDGVRDPAGNHPLQLPAIAVSACEDHLPPVIDPASARVLPSDTTVAISATASEPVRLGVEVSALAAGEACGSLPELPLTRVAWADVPSCPGHDPCGAASRCPVTSTATGLCPGRKVKVRLLAEDLSGNAAAPGAWLTTTTGSPASRVVLTEVLADAATPQAGGEYAEIANLGSGDADLTGWRLAKRSASGTVSRCTIEPKAGLLPAGGHGLIVGGSWDGRYTIPSGVPLFVCGSTSVAGGLADDRPPAIALESPTGTVVSGFGWAATGLRCTGRSVERIQPGGEDAISNLACARTAPGTPGACNGTTPIAACPRRPY